MAVLTVSVFVVAMTALTTAFETTIPPPPDAGGTGDPWEYFHTTVPPTEDYFGGWHPSCPPGWTMFDIQCLLFVKEEKTWAEAETNCHYQGGNLVHVIQSTSIDTTRDIQQLLQDAGHHDGQIWVQDCNEKHQSWMWMFYGFFSTEDKSSCLQIGEGGPPTTFPPTTVPDHPTTIPSTTVPCDTVPGHEDTFETTLPTTVPARRRRRVRRHGPDLTGPRGHGGRGGGGRGRRSGPSGCSTNEQCHHLLPSICSILIY